MEEKDREEGVKERRKFVGTRKEPERENCKGEVNLRIGEKKI